MRSRAAILYEYGTPWSVEEFEPDPPRSGEVLVRLAATGLCHSDEHIRQGRLAPPPDALGALGPPAMSPTIDEKPRGHPLRIRSAVIRRSVRTRSAALR